ncbi:hypothetical protein C8J25_1227 [Sphingomonas faeni]|uniref:LysE type translocator n=1 Tax=Sphingomonas faeni TaxID=185950 RepID=A0A2T5TVY5_9SPHN|nr:hypothetical protein [Sphingomonas faeni]PTW43427.1 hypothetical protein C8J25_1227 [Sphingomonas faeni]
MEHVIVIAGVVWLAAISPGAVFAMISRLSAVQGRRLGLIAAAGIAMAFAQSRSIVDDAAVALGNARAFVTRLLTDVLDPKTSMFVVSLYAQTMGGAAPISVQLA